MVELEFEFEYEHLIDNGSNPIIETPMGLAVSLVIICAVWVVVVLAARWYIHSRRDR